MQEKEEKGGKEALNEAIRYACSKLEIDELRPMQEKGSSSVGMKSPCALPVPLQSLMTDQYEHFRQQLPVAVVSSDTADFNAFEN